MSSSCFFHEPIHPPIDLSDQSDTIKVLESSVPPPPSSASSSYSSSSRERQRSDSGAAAPRNLDSPDAKIADQSSRKVCSLNERGAQAEHASPFFLVTRARVFNLAIFLSARSSLGNTHEEDVSRLKSAKKLGRDRDSGEQACNPDEFFIKSG